MAPTVTCCLRDLGGGGGRGTLHPFVVGDNPPGSPRSCWWVLQHLVAWEWGEWSCGEYPDCPGWVHRHRTCVTLDPLC